MSIRIDSLDKIKKKIGLNQNGPVLDFFTETCYKEMDKYVPMSAGNSKGSLRNTVHLTTNTITYMSPYASYQYYGKRKDGTRVIKNWTTPGTGPRWDRRMKSVDIKKIAREVSNYIKTHGGY